MCFFPYIALEWRPDAHALLSADAKRREMVRDIAAHHGVTPTYLEPRKKSPLATRFAACRDVFLPPLPKQCGCDWRDADFAPYPALFTHLLRARELRRVHLAFHTIRDEAERATPDHEPAIVEAMVTEWKPARQRDGVHWVVSPPPWDAGWKRDSLVHIHRRLT